MTKPQSTRERFRELVAREPNLISSEIADRLGVTRQRISAIAASEGYTLDRGGPGATLTPPAPKAPPIADRIVSVVADLSSRGYAVYAPITEARPCDLVAVDPTGRVEQIEIEKPKRSSSGAVRYDTPENERRVRRVAVLTDAGIAYSPALRRKD